MNRLNLRLTTSFAFCVFGGAIFWTSTLNEQASFSQFASPRFLQGLGVAFFYLPLNQILLAGVPPNDLASASGLSNFVRTMAGSIATAVSVWMWNRRTDYHHTVLIEHIRNSAQGWTQYQADLNARGISGTGAFQYVDRIIGTQASTLAVNDVFFFLGCLFILLIPFVWLAKPPFKARGSDAVALTGSDH